jgi:sarcosine oxidase
LKIFDVIVVGCGAMGSSLAYHLSQRGIRTLVLERFRLNHPNGSSHGKSRIIRTAYAEHPAYVPLVQRAFKLWRELEKRSGDELLVMTGGLMIGSPDSSLIAGVERSAREHDLPHERLGPEEVRERFPIFRLADVEVAVYEKNAGKLFPEKCIATNKRLAEENGADFHFEEPLASWDSDGSTVEVRTAKGAYGASKIALTSGPWVSSLVRDLKLPLKTERQVMFWFAPKEHQELFSVKKMPIFIWGLPDTHDFYGLPDGGDGVKVAQSHGGIVSEPDRVDRRVSPRDELPVRDFIRSHIPAADGRVISSATCVYTNSPDGHFIIDFHPTRKNVMVVSPCSGHGFKFSSVIGEVVTDLLTEGRAEFDLSLFRLSRFSSSGGL